MKFLIFSLLLSPVFAFGHPADFESLTVKFKEVDSGTYYLSPADMQGDCSNLNIAEPTPMPMPGPDNGKKEGDKTNPVPGSGGGIGFDTIINYGERIWKIVEANKPVVSVQEKSANGLPRGIQCWTDLGQWSVPKYKTYEVSYENLMGMEVASFRFNLFYSHSGSYEGTGQYLANVSIQPMNIDVIWGFKLDATVKVGRVLNTGTKESPIAGIQMNMDWALSSVMKISKSQVSYFIEGDGTVQTYK